MSYCVLFLNLELSLSFLIPVVVFFFFDLLTTKENPSSSWSEKDFVELLGEDTIKGFFY